MRDYLKRITAKKQKLDRLAPLPQEMLRQLEAWLRVELTYSSNAIEGNTLTRIETAEVLGKGVAATIGKSLKDQLEAINHAKAVDFVKGLAKQRKSPQDITEQDILSIHKIILTGIDDEWAGRYRHSEVFVKGASVTFPLPQNVPYEMDEFVQWLEQLQDQHPVKIATDAHFNLVTIHPFVDGNGRTARLLMNLILLICWYPMAVIRNEERTEYLDAVNRGQMKGDLEPLYGLVSRAVERSLDAYISAAQGKPSLTPLVQGVETKKARLLKIGELAAATGETIHTLRYWTKENLLSVSGHTEGGYQLYEPDMIERARQIRHLQNRKRLTLREIAGELKKSA